jgi:hypothetical protein
VEDDEDVNELGFSMAHRPFAPGRNFAGVGYVVSGEAPIVMRNREMIWRGHAGGVGTGRLGGGPG